MKTSIFLILITVAALGVRAAAVLALRDVGVGPTRALGADGLEYDHLARSVVNGTGYGYQPGQPTSFRAPGFPLTLAGLYLLPTPPYATAYAAFCLMGTAACVATYFFAREVLSERTARLAAALLVIYVPHVYFATEFATENLFVLCLTITGWQFLRHLRTGSVMSLVVAGAVLGWAALTRPFALLVVPVLVLALVIGQRRTGFRVAPFALLIMCVLVVIVPWTIRNYNVHGSFVLVATNGGSTFYGGNNDRVLNEPSHRGGWLSTTELPHRDLVDATPNEVVHDKVEWMLGLRWVRENLTQLPKLLAYKLARFWIPDVDSPNKRYVAIQVLGYTPFLLWFLIGWCRCLRDRVYRTLGWAYVHGVLFATMATGLIFWGSPRFRDSNAPVLMLYAAVGLEAILVSVGRLRQDHPSDTDARVA